VLQIVYALTNIADSDITMAATPSFNIAEAGLVSDYSLRLLPLCRKRHEE
jgi:hypothetical protein